MKTTTQGRNNGIQWTLTTQLDDLDFADDIALLSHNNRQMQDKTSHLELTSAQTRLKINTKKTELMKHNTAVNTPITVAGASIREVDSFTYLGSVIDKEGGTENNVKARIGKAYAAFIMLKNIWSSKCICLNTKLRIFNSNVKSVLLYGCETWRMVKSTNRKLQTFINTCLRRILKIRWTDKVPYEEIWRQTKQEPIDTQITRRKRGWIGHTFSKPASNTTTQALFWNPQGKRKRGWPWSTWRRNTNAKLKKWGTTWHELQKTAQNRVRWQTVVDGLCSAMS
ncbi:hypothetical protein ElyMa_001220900 [Elysia marginata]|uniref:DUF6451 domain-containing protein n=1 Tax=Elysia marginata TaxID=1093978 RepID=A0AAV4I8T7_9GAST|nr:hypothetical protein ElyMa_001220900 [Elysia marginata]